MIQTRIPFVCCFAFTIWSVLFAGCPFCNQAVIESQMVYEDTYFRVLVDYAPLMPGHLLAIPKRHIAMAQEMTEEEWGDLRNIVPKVVQVFQKAYNTDQYIFLEKNGPFAGQSVPHVHFHMLPMPSCYSLKELSCKVFNLVPKKMSQEEIQETVLRLRPLFETAH